MRALIDIQLLEDGQYVENQVIQAQSGCEIVEHKQQHADSTGMGLQTMGGQPVQQAQRPTGETKRKPVAVAVEPGRNDTVTVQNMSTGETRSIKWKHAKKLVDEQGWVLVES